VSATPWLALAGAVMASASPAGVGHRVERLAGGGRLARPPVPGARRVLAGLPWRPIAGAAAVVGVSMTGVVGGPLLAIAAAAVAGAVWTMARDALGQREAVARRAELLRALRVLIAELAAGGRPSAALTAAGAAAPRCSAVFAAAAAAAARGHDAGAVLIGGPDTRPIGLAWQLGEETGLALGGVLDRVAADLAAADEQRRTVAIALAGARSSAALLTGLPVLGLALGAAMGAHPGGFLLGAGAGRAVCCAGVLLDVAGVLWMRAILRRAERP
jgi:tight adherence protein B